jgi:polysaccharide export outer membrane protein
MNRKTLLTVVMLLGSLAAISAFAQSQSPTVQTPGTTPVQPAYQPSSIDNQGIVGYRLGPGDLLDVRVFGQPDLNSTVEIDEDGNISSLPFIEDPIPAKCRSEKEVQKSITTAYAKYLVQPRVSVRILERRSRPPATVFGAVRTPARVPMLRRVRLHELLAAAGGTTATASGSIQIVHTQPELCPEPDEMIQPVAATESAAAQTVNNTASDVGQLETFQLTALKNGTGNGDPFIRPGDIVIVTEGEPVFVTGAVISPRELVMKDQLSLARAIAMAGGVQKLAKTSEVHIYRTKEGKVGSEDLKFNFDAIKKGQQPDVPLQAYDIIDVRQVGAMSGKSWLEIIRGLGTGTLGVLPMRMPIP